MPDAPRRDRSGKPLDFDADRKAGEHESTLAREKFDPAMRGAGKSQEQVQAEGGLGALARKVGKKPTAEDAGAALAKRKRSYTNQ